MFHKWLKVLPLFFTLVLVACGDSDDFDVSGEQVDNPNVGGVEDGGSNSDSGDDSGDGSGDDSGGDSGGDSGSDSNVSFNLLLVHEAYADFSGFDEDGLYRFSRNYPFIDSFLINPIDTTDFESTTTATAADLRVTVDDVEIDDTESFPLLQKVVGNQVFIETALVFDVSGSVNDVDLSLLVAEAKAYVAEAQASDNELISTQKFVVWAFGTQVVELSDGFTDVAAEIDTALDLVVTRAAITNPADADYLGVTSNLHKAMVEVVGRYQDDDHDFLDISTGDNNDLVDIASSDGILLSQVVLFSSGADSFLEVAQELMIKAIDSQGFSITVDGQEVFTKKPVFYYVVGGSSQGVAYEALSDVSERTTHIVESEGAYDFAAALISYQIEAVDDRIDLDNQYIYRYAYLPRIGEHTFVFSSRTESHTSSLTGQTSSEDTDINIGPPSEELASLVEVTGSGGEYLSFGVASLEEMATFGFSTRWVNEDYTSDDYSWSIAGGTGTASANGSYTVDSVAGVSATLSLTNTVLGHTSSILVTD